MRNGKLDFCLPNELEFLYLLVRGCMGAGLLANVESMGHAPRKHVGAKDYAPSQEKNVVPNWK